MKLLRLPLLFLLFAFSTAASPNPLQAPDPNPARPLLTTAAPADAMVVYVSDFDLDVAYRKPSPKPAPHTSAPPAPRRTIVSASGVRRGRPSTASDASDSSNDSTEQTPAEQATALVNAVSENIIRALTEAGYDARRLAKGEAPPQRGLRIRGVFAEADERNRARRLLVGGEPVSPNMILFVGVNNLTHPEQPLYELADPPANDLRHGPVIIVTSYAPAERFEVSRDPSGDELKKIAQKIAADFAALVNVNRLSLAQ